MDRRRMLAFAFLGLLTAPSVLGGTAPGTTPDSTPDANLVGLAGVEAGLPALDETCAAAELCGDLPLVLDEGGDTMEGRLRMDAALQLSPGVPVAFAGGDLTGDGTLAYRGLPVCLAQDAAPGCGDVTGVGAGWGLRGGGPGGDVALSIDPGVVQRRVEETCPPGSSLRAISVEGLVTCEEDDDTTYTAGDGLRLDGTQFDVNLLRVQERVLGVCALGFAIRAIAQDGTVACERDSDTLYGAGRGLTHGGGNLFHVDPGLIQNRVTGLCSAGTSIASIAEDGTVACERDDDTIYAAGSGLTLSGTTFGVDPAVTQRRVTGACAAGSSIASIATNGTVSCEGDDDTTYAAGTGLLLAGTTFSADTGVLQRRVTGTCTTGSSIRAIDATGAVTCETDDGTAYTAGTGLVLTGTTFNADTGVLQRRITGTCTTGSSIRAIDATGAVTCETDDGTAYTAGTGLVLTGTEFRANAAYLQRRLSSSCPPGSALTGVAEDGGVTCVGLGTWGQLSGKPAGFADDQDNDLLAALACASQQVAKWNGSAWTCAADLDTDTTYAAGFALALTGTTFSADTTLLQRRVATSCPAGQAIRAISQDGAVTCEFDDGAGGVTWATVASKPPGFSDDLDNDTLGGLSCSAQQVAAWNGTAWACANDASTTYTAGPGLTLAGGQFAIAGGGVTSGMILDGTIWGDLDLADGSVTSSLLASGAVTSNALADGSITNADVSPTAAIAKSKLALTNSIGTSDILDGTIRNQDLDAGAVTGTKIALGNVDTHHLVDGAVTRVKVAVDAVDGARIANGTVGPEDLLVRPWRSVPRGTSVVEVDNPANAVGTYSSLTIGDDGYPVIAYHDATDNDLLVAKCYSLDCSSRKVTVVDSAGNVGLYSSIAIGTDGKPVIAYRDATNLALKVVKCGTLACDAGNTVTRVYDPGPNVGTHVALAIGTDGLPVVAFRNETAQSLMFLKCSNAACSGGSVRHLDNGANDVGYYPSVAISPEYLAPIIAYRDATADALKVFYCTDAECGGTSGAVQINDAQEGGRFPSIAIGGDGYPILTFQDDDGDLVMKKCSPTENSCSGLFGWETIAEGGVTHSSLALGLDGLPVVAWAEDGALKYVKCGSADCAVRSAPVVVDSGGMGDHASLALGADGLPVIAYRDGPGDALRVAHLANEYGLPFLWRRG